LQHKLEEFGYAIKVFLDAADMLNMQGWGEYDAVTTGVIASFQMHFRQHTCNGQADAETQAVLDKLLEMRG